MPLTARQAEHAKPKEKEYKLTDSQGLYLLVKPSGAKYWRYKYHFAGKEKSWPSVFILTYPLPKHACAVMKPENYWLRTKIHRKKNKIKNGYTERSKQIRLKQYLLNGYCRKNNSGVRITGKILKVG